MTPEVSIICIAYNHEEYIEKTLQSFIMQRTNFDYEILVHDDASTDNTAKIIRKYEKQYPNIIKPIYQTVNQYSQGIEIVYEFMYKRAKGNFLASSEGDDYWTDPLKLQKQYDFMKDHPEVSACIHADKLINEKGDRILGYRKLYKRNKFMSVKETVFKQKTVPTNSIFMRNYFTSDYVIPDWYFNADVTDFPLCLYLSTKGKIYYMNEVMSAYRVAAQNSWTRRTMSDSEKRRRHVDSMITLLKSFDEYTGYAYSPSIEKQISRNKLGYLMADEYQRMNDPKHFFEQLKTKGLKGRLKYSIYSLLPRSVILQRRIKYSKAIQLFKRKEIFPSTDYSINSND